MENQESKERMQIAVGRTLPNGASGADPNDGPKKMPGFAEKKDNEQVIGLLHDPEINDWLSKGDPKNLSQQAVKPTGEHTDIAGSSAENPTSVPELPPGTERLDGITPPELRAMRRQRQNLLPRSTSIPNI